MPQFKELPIGARFRLKTGPSREYIKIEPILHESGSVKYNVRSVGETIHNKYGYGHFGHNRTVIVPPYGDTTGAPRQKTRYYKFKAVVVDAGWESISEMETAMINGIVAVPRKPNEGNNES